MKMARPSKEDIVAAEALFRLISGIGNEVIPAISADDDGEVEDLDPTDTAHQRRIGEALLNIISNAPPSGIERVLGGMLFVILFDQNKIIDPDSDVLELHPQMQAAMAAYKSDRATEVLPQGQCLCCGKPGKPKQQLIACPNVYVCESCCNKVAKADCVGNPGISVSIDSIESILAFLALCREIIPPSGQDDKILNQLVVYLESALRAEKQNPTNLLKLSELDMRALSLDAGDHPPISGHDALWNWFGLSYATFLTMPRLMMHAMPDDWQRKMAALCREWDETWDSQNMPAPQVSAMAANNRFTRWPAELLNYRHPDAAFIESMRKPKTEPGL